jgi:hypothetical protein
MAVARRLYSPQHLARCYAVLDLTQAQESSDVKSLHEANSPGTIGTQVLHGAEIAHNSGNSGGPAGSYEPGKRCDVTTGRSTNDEQPASIHNA